jgi:hypothetical protein
VKALLSQNPEARLKGGALCLLQCLVRSGDGGEHPLSGEGFGQGRPRELVWVDGTRCTHVRLLDVVGGLGGHCNGVRVFQVGYLGTQGKECCRWDSKLWAIHGTCSLEREGTLERKRGTGMAAKLLQVGPCTRTHIPTHPLQP